MTFGGKIAVTLGALALACTAIDMRAPTKCRR